MAQQESEITVSSGSQANCSRMGQHRTNACTHVQVWGAFRDSQAQQVNLYSREQRQPGQIHSHGAAWMGTCCTRMQARAGHSHVTLMSSWADMTTGQQGYARLGPGLGHRLSRLDLPLPGLEAWKIKLRTGFTQDPKLWCTGSAPLQTAFQPVPQHRPWSCYTRDWQRAVSQGVNPSGPTGYRA